MYVFVHERKEIVGVTFFFRENIYIYIFAFCVSSFVWHATKCIFFYQKMKWSSFFGRNIYIYISVTNTRVFYNLVNLCGFYFLSLYTRYVQCTNIFI